MTGSSKLWILVHIVFPLSPFLLGGILRLLITTLSIDTFSASELSISLGLLSLFVQQNLINREHPLNTGATEDDVKAAATGFLISAIVFFVFFGSISAIRAVAANSSATTLESALWKLQVFVFCVAPFLIVATYRTQKSFKLRATI